MKITVSTSKPVVAFSTIRVGDVFSDDPGHYYMKLVVSEEEDYNALMLDSYRTCWVDDSMSVHRCDAHMTIVD